MNAIESMLVPVGIAVVVLVMLMPEWLQRLCLYPLGKVILRVVTIGRYPPPPAWRHNRRFVAMVPLVLTGFFITLIYS